jgi:integrase
VPQLGPLGVGELFGVLAIGPALFDPVHDCSSSLISCLDRSITPLSSRSVSSAEARWGGWDADKLTTELLEAAYLEMLNGGRRQYRRNTGTQTTETPMSNRSVEAFHKAVKTAYGEAIKRGKLTHNPAALATPPVVGEQQRPYWTPDQVGIWIDYLAADGPLCGVEGLAEQLIDSGGRRGEVLGLHWDDVDLDGGTATLWQQLSTDPRSHKVSLRQVKRPRSKSVIGLHPDTVAALRRRQTAHKRDRLRVGAGWPKSGSLDHDLLFTWPDGRAIHPDVLTRTVARLSVAAGLPRLTPHGLRRSFATAALKARVPIEVVAARLGNTPRVVQETYQRVIPADDQGAAQLVGDLYRRLAQS